MRTVALRVTALALLLMLALVTVLTVRTLKRLPDSLIYLVSSGETSFSLEAVGRRSNLSDPQERLKYLLQAMISGPTDKELARGLHTAFPADTRLLDVRLVAGVAEVNLSANFAQGGGTSRMQSRLNQLFYTLTQAKGVEAVSLRIDGEKVTLFSQEGLIVDNPWYRQAYPGLPSW